MAYEKQGFRDGRKLYASQLIDMENGIINNEKNKLDKSLGAKHAGKLLYVDDNGDIVTLSLGSSISIENGVLNITGGGSTETADQIFYTSDGKVFHTLDDAMFYVKGE